MKYLYVPVVLLLFASCGLKPENATSLHKQARISPDFSDVTMPCNIAAPTFALDDSASEMSNLQAVFRSGDKTIVVSNDGDDGFCISLDDWADIVNASQRITVTIQGQKDGKWMEYDPFCINISKDTIDSYLSYRLIEPGYEVWNKMGIYQRNLTDYDERAILTNDDSDGGCMNCHSYCNRDASKMSMHLRLSHGGTYIVDNGKVDVQSPKPSFVYPSWHPDGRYIAYSQNNTKQMFHTTDKNRVEVFDLSSDVIVYDTKTGNVLTSPLLNSKAVFETFPSWSADGKTLYYCAADSVKIPDDYDKAHYSLCSIQFDDATGKFGDKVDTLYSASKSGGSISFPRESPDGRWLMFTRSSYGNFSIWHKDAELWLLDLHQSTPRSAQRDACLSKNTNHPSPITQLNSPDVESYHSWSSTGRWVVFSSRRDDGLYTRPYIAHFDGIGKFSKPFPLPQPSAIYSRKLLKSYNIPEFTINAFDDIKELKEAVDNNE